MIIRDELGDKYLYSYNTLTKEKKRIGHISQEMGSIYLLYDSYSDRIIVIKSDSIMVVNAKSYMCHRINNSIEQIRDCHLINLNRDKYIKLTQLFLVKYVNNNIAMTVAKFI